MLGALPGRNEIFTGLHPRAMERRREYLSSRFTDEENAQ